MPVPNKTEGEPLLETAHTSPTEGVNTTTTSGSRKAALAAAGLVVVLALAAVGAVFVRKAPEGVGKDTVTEFKKGGYWDGAFWPSLAHQCACCD